MNNCCIVYSKGEKKLSSSHNFVAARTVTCTAIHNIVHSHVKLIGMLHK